ncbi:MAG: hypothetical protein NVS4B3_18330 [Gemmatimonadaceae bacterium]
MQANGSWTRRGAAVFALGVTIALPGLAPAQNPGPTPGPGQCTFTILPDAGNFTFGKTIHLTGRAGASSQQGSFVLVNVPNPVPPPGGCDYNALIIAAKLNLVNVANPSLAIGGQNIVVTRMPRSLPTGQSAEVNVSVELPAGTVAGRYVGAIEIRDDIRGVAISPTGEILNRDVILVEVTVVENPGFALISSDSAARLDSLIIRGRAGTRATGVLRIANIGNAPLTNVRVTSSDLRSESAVGLVIPADRIKIQTGEFPAIAVSDTQRVVVTVDIPRGILGGRYRGTLFVQSSGAPPVQLPLIVIVTSSRGILFGNNPVRSSLGDIAQIAFNADPGTQYRLGIFDMTGIMTYETSGPVFAGIGPPGPGGIGRGADFAVNVSWSLANGRGIPVASGMYLVVVESIVNGQRTLARDRLMVIR